MVKPVTSSKTGHRIIHWHTMWQWKGVRKLTCKLLSAEPGRWT